MVEIFDEDARNPGPAALGHDPVVLPEVREKAVETVESTGLVSFRNSPALPFIENPNR